VIGRWLERALALSAALLAPLALRFLSLPAVLTLCDRWPALSWPRYSPHALSGRVQRWLAYGRGPWLSSCLTRSVVLYVMLRQHGYRPRFFIGVSGEERAFGAHAWVTLGGAPVGDWPNVTSGYTHLLAHGA